MSIRIDVARDDGQVTRLVGESGMAACMGPLSDHPILSDPPMTSLRWGNEAELAWNLAALMAAVRHSSPHAFRMAGELMELCNFRDPIMGRHLPRRS